MKGNTISYVSPTHLKNLVTNSVAAGKNLISVPAVPPIIVVLVLTSPVLSRRLIKALGISAVYNCVGPDVGTEFASASAAPPVAVERARPACGLLESRATTLTVGPPEFAAASSALRLTAPRAPTTSDSSTLRVNRPLRRELTPFSIAAANRKCSDVSCIDASR